MITTTLNLGCMGAVEDQEESSHIMNMKGPLVFRIIFKILIGIQAPNGFSSSYLSDFLLTFDPSRSHRSSDRGLLNI